MLIRLEGAHTLDVSVFSRVEYARACSGLPNGRISCSQARQLFVNTPLSTTSKHQVEEDKAEQDGELTSVDRGEEALRRMGHEVSHRHITREDERDWTGEKPNKN